MLLSPKLLQGSDLIHLPAQLPAPGSVMVVCGAVNTCVVALSVASAQPPTPTAGAIRTKEDGLALILQWSLPSSAVRATHPWHKGERQIFVFFCLSSQSHELSFRTQQINEETHVLDGVAQLIKRGEVSI